MPLRGGAADDITRLGRFLDAVPRVHGVGLWAYDYDTGATHWSPEMRRIIGAAGDAVPSLEAWLAAVHPVDRSAMRELAESRFVGGKRSCRIIRGPGDVHDVLAYGVLVPGGGGRELFVGVVDDLTDRARGGEHHVRLLDAISDAYVMVDRGWRFTVVNREAERLVGRGARELIGRVLWEEFPVVLNTRIEEACRRAMGTGTPVAIEEHYAPRDIWLELRIHPMPEGLAIYLREITERRRREAARDRELDSERTARRIAESARDVLAHMATHDRLTGLLTRHEALRILDERLAVRQATTVMFLDLDRFKIVNDSIGHHAGDSLLRITAERIRAHAGPDAVVARVGGDEFLVGLPTADVAAVSSRVDGMTTAFRRPVALEGMSVICTASIGIASRVDGAASAIARDADVALQRAKALGRDRAVWFDEELRREVTERMRLEFELRHAVDRDEVDVVYQPMFDVRTGRAVGVETLARWELRGQGPIPPARFIPVAEDTGLVVPLGDQIMRRALDDARPWVPDDGRWTTWVNVAPQQLARAGYADRIARMLDRTGIAPSRLGLEVTESMLIDAEAAVAELRILSRLGVRVAIDDFGTGHSSIARLRALPVDALKVDRAFIRDICTDAGLATVRAIVDLGHALGMTVVAEGVESREELEAVRECACDVVSGYLLGRPVPADLVPPMLRAGCREVRGSV